MWDIDGGTRRDLGSRKGWARRVPGAGTRVVGVKELAFWQKRSPNCDFLVLHSPFTLSTSKNI
jgi:hypothetical protein